MQSFNPRPPSMAGDPAAPPADPAPARVFQSAPAIDGGRSSTSVSAPVRLRCFNPRPPSMAGDPLMRCSRSAPPLRFNPRPPSMAGDPAGGRRRVVRRGVVSIRARHRWRAIHAPPRPCHRSCARFNPRPPSMAGDPRACATWACTARFQSAPAIDGGRSGAVAGRAVHDRGFNPRPPSMAGDPPSRDLVRRSTCSFNPRPPSMAGDPSELRMLLGWLEVSIRARHRWRAILLSANSAAAWAAVSIRARHRWRAIPGWTRGALLMWLVSIRARHRWRAIRGWCGRPRPARMFQSAPAIDGGRSTINS
mgnify:FL=1